MSCVSTRIVQTTVLAMLLPANHDPEDSDCRVDVLVGTGSALYVEFG